MLLDWLVVGLGCWASWLIDCAAARLQATPSSVGGAVDVVVVDVVVVVVVVVAVVVVDVVVVVVVVVFVIVFVAVGGGGVCFIGVWSLALVLLLVALTSFPRASLHPSRSPYCCLGSA